jgi:hypothetical protein
MKLFFTVIFLLNNLIGFCQIDLFFPLNKEFDWTKIEKQDQALKANFIKNLPDELEPRRECGGFSNLENDLHIIDFDSDGLDDIIYNGYLCSEAEYVIVYINTGKSFTKIFTETQQIHKIVIKNGKVDRLYIRDGGCCCEYIGINKIFSVDYSGTLPKINPISKMQYINNSVEEYPNHYFDKPIKFEVLNNRYNIRFSPVIDDTTEVGYCGMDINGNSLGKLKSGSIGYALAENVDSTGRIWWFVAIEPVSEIYESIYYDETRSPDTYKLGWISSRFVKEINE